MERILNLDNYWNIEKLILKKNKIRKIFFYRVCGTGMGATACLLKEMGFIVTGSDQSFYPPMGDYLKDQQIELINQSEITENNLQEFDLVVVGNVVPKLSQDAKLIEECGVPFTSFPSVLGAFVLKDKNVIGISGTHGKTTTSYFLVQMLENIGLKPGYFIGGVIDGRPSSFLGSQLNSKKDKYFVIEADEYDSSYFEKFSKFLSYQMDSIILTSLEFDHADIFNSIEDIKNEFKKLKSENLVHKIICNEYEAALNLFLDVDFYGDATNIGPSMIEGNENGSNFTLRFDNQNFLFETNIVGNHNIKNISSCIIYCVREGFDIEQIRASIKNLQMVKRRQEVRGKYKDTILIDDFAHHPTAIKSTIELIQMKYPNFKINVVLEPNSATARSSLFQAEFSSSLEQAHSVFLCCPSRKSTIKDQKDLDLSLISKQLVDKGISCEFSSSLDDLKLYLDQHLGLGELYLILSNSTCLGLWSSDFVESIKN